MRKTIVFAGMTLIALLAPIPDCFSATDAQPNHLMVPQSIRYEHNQIIDRLTKEAAKSGVAAAVAQRLLVVMKAHFAKEEDFVFPPLGLLDQITAGEMPSDSVKKTAIEMADRTRAAAGDLNEEHLQITSMMDELIQAATRANEPGLAVFATDVAAHSLNEIEILLPTTILIGDYLRSNSPAGRQ
jgi:hypothetical protein